MPLHPKYGLMMMRGSGGDFDYVLLANDKDLGLGFKITGMNKPGDGPWPLSSLISCTLNVRTARLPAETLALLNVTEAFEGNFLDHNPWNVVWAKNDSERRSTPKLFTFKKGSPTDPEAAVEYIRSGEAVDDLIDALFKMAPPSMLCIDHDKLKAFLAEGMEQNKLLLLSHMIMQNAPKYAEDFKGGLFGADDLGLMFFDIFKDHAGTDHPNDPRLAKKRFEEKKAKLETMSKQSNESGSAVLIKKANKAVEQDDTEEEHPDDSTDSFD